MSQPASSPVLNRHRLALLVVVAVYPIITGLLLILGPLTVGWEVWERSLIIAPVMVALMVYGLIPFISKTFRSFLFRG